MKFLLCLLLLTSYCFGQNDSLLNSCSKRDNILFPENLDHYFKQLEMNTSGESELINKSRIIQIGDSHILIGQFPTSFSEALDTLVHPTVENSFWFPYALFGGYTPKGFTVKCDSAKAEKMVNSSTGNRFTITGYALVVPAIGSQEIAINCVKKKFSRFEILLEENLEWKIEADSAAISKRMISEHLAVYSIQGDFDKSLLRLRLVNTDDAKPLRIFGFREPEISNKQDYQFYGSSGGKLADYVNNDAYLSEFITFSNPGLFIVSLGTNDSYLKQSSSHIRKNLKKLVREIQDNSSASILFTLPPDTYFENKSPQSISKIRKQILKIAKKKKCAVWDFCSVMGGEKSMLTWHTAGLSSEDLLHLNSDGYRMQGLLLAQALLKVYMRPFIIK